MEQVGYVAFEDRETSSNGFAAVRVGRGVIALAVSLEVDGDIEVFLTLDAATALKEVLDRAIARAG